MRFVALIIFVQILVAVSTPCPDAISSGSMFASVSTRAAADVKAPDEGEDHDEECSPSCICSCRQVPASSVAFCEPPAEAAMNDAVQKVAFRYRDDPETTFRESIWQPPQA